MSEVRAVSITPVAAKPVPTWFPIAAAVSGIVAGVAAALLSGPNLGQDLLVGVVVLALALWAIRSPTRATLLLLVALFLLLPLRSLVHIHTDAFKWVLALLIVSSVLWIYRTRGRLNSIGAVEWAMALFLTWNVYSMLAPHHYNAGPQVPEDKVNELPFSVPSFIGLGVLIPLVFYAVGRFTFDRTAAVRAALWTMLAVAAYSAAMSIMPFTGPTDWVWPRYILHEPRWIGRAVGVFAQPFENGMVLALGLGVAVLLLNQRNEPAGLRLVAFVVAVGCGLGIYLTHTRAIWLSAAAVLIIGTALAKGVRKLFIAGLGLVMTMIVVNWSIFSSGDREAGGVASVTEIQDRLNINQTALWAATHKPLTGWGVGRFFAVNTYHHQQWALNTPWIRGYGDASHENELGILAELGLIGLALWLCVLVLIAHRLWRAYRTLPDGDLCGKPLAVMAIMAFAILLCTGLTVDLRFFGFPIAAIFLLVGIAIGWSDRHARGRATGSDVAERTRPQHV
jgi:O-antigen ligase